ncbi:MAG: PNGase F N-terminal domain-containing protein [Flavobacterium sp.]
MENQDPILVLAQGEWSLLTSQSIFSATAKYPYEQTLVHHAAGVYFQNAHLNASQSVSMKDSTSLAKQTIEIKNERKKILGYWCTKAVTVVNSNTIELWFTTDLKVKGAPTILGQQLGLVLEMVRNNNCMMRASKVERLKSLSLDTKIFNANLVDALTYRDMIWNARFSTIPVFAQEKIHFSDQTTANTGVQKFANGTIAIKKVDFPKLASNAHLFLELTTQSTGAAYDRTGSVFMIPEDKIQSFKNGLEHGVSTLPEYQNGNGNKYQGVAATNEYNPPIELMRFFTPFGVGQYNYIQLKGKTWLNEVSYRQDLSEFVNYLSEKSVWIGVFIGNYDAGGHEVTAEFTVHEGEMNYFSTQKMFPLFQTTNVMEMAGQNYGTMFDHENGMEVKIRLDQPLKNATLRYISTGHGAWLNGDEFVSKINKIFLNQSLVYSFIPWRSDCGSYRLYNPASSNFNNGLSSSDYSRSNWCPGTTTSPVFIPLGNLEAGEHTFKIQIPQGKPEGESFSSWNVSGVLIGE